jgi:hypothetical protein
MSQNELFLLLSKVKEKIGLAGSGSYRLDRGARKLTGQNLGVVWAEFSTLKLVCFSMSSIA